MAVETTALQEPIPPAPPEGPPSAKLPPGEWVRRNLFSSVANGVVTVVMGVVIAWAAYRAVRWVFVTAEWEIVRRNLTSFMIGSFPRDQLWRPWASLFVVAATIGAASGMAAAEVGDRPRARAPWWTAARRFWPIGALLVAIALLVETVVPVLLLAAALAGAAA
ncbi:MAG TPA: hypothetical protein VF640_03140, partial [Acidimicrobiales bacterium]